MLSLGHGDSKMTTDTRLVSRPSGISFVFDSFRLFPTQRLLTESDKPVHLGSRAFDILLALLERPGELVSKEELMAKVWPKTFVAPANLSVHISALRQALGEQWGRNRYLLNVPGRGYRFIAPVTVEKDLPSDSVAAAPKHEPNLPTHIKPTSRPEIVEGLAQHLQKGHLLAVVGRDGIGQRTPTLVLVEKLIEAHGNSVWLVDLSSIEKS